MRLRNRNKNNPGGLPESSADYYYSGLIATSIKVHIVDGSTDDGSTKVTFNESDGNGTEAIFLKEIRMTSNPENVVVGKRAFEATKVEIDEAKSITTKGFGNNTSTPLFIVHGFNVEPSQALRHNYDIFKEDMLYYPVPVLWGCEGGITSYLEAHTGGSMRAGKAMKDFVQSIPNTTFPRKSLAMHSMGNHAIFNGACAIEKPDAEFENIFMVAADVPYDIFHKNPDESYWFRKEVNGNKKEKADNFFGMLAKKSDGKTPKGKIYIVWNDKDFALKYSPLFNREARIGKTGVGWVDGWFRNHYDTSIIRDEFKDYIENRNATDEAMVNDPFLKHSYQLEPWAANFYEEKCKLIEQE